MRKKTIAIISLLPIFVLLFSNLIIFNFIVIQNSYAVQYNYIYGTANEGEELIVSAPEGAYFTNVIFASYGTPNNYTQGSCHSETSTSIISEQFLGKQQSSIYANNQAFGDPCSGTYKKIEVVLEYEFLNINPFLNSPDNIEVTLLKDSIFINWNAPAYSGTNVERYAIFWTTENYNGWGISSTTTSTYISLDTIQNTGGLDKVYRFSIRADNDSQSIYSNQSSFVELFIYKAPEFTCYDGFTVTDQTLCPIEPTRTETQTVEPSPTSTTTTEPKPEETSKETPVPTKTPSELPTEPSRPKPTNISKPIEPTTPKDSDSTEEKVAYLIDIVNSGQSVSVEMIESLGIDYEDLPVNTPVELENGVVLTAETVDALEIIENPSEILGTVFSDPGKALVAFVSIGADMTPEKRKESQKVVIVAIIAGQVLLTTSMVGRIR